MSNWPLPGGAVKEPADDQNFRALSEKGGEVEAALVKVEKEGVAPSGAAGGVLKGTYPNPEFATPQATKAELENETATRESKDATEKAVRESADTTLTSADATEKSARESADTTIKGEVKTEKEARETADNERVKGPASATESDIAVYNGTTGKIIKDGGKTITEVLARANHTGTQLASTVSDFDEQVRKSTLNQMTAPTADLSINSHKLTNVLDPTAVLDAANKEYVDAAAAAAAAGLSVKNPVSYASTAAITATAEAAKTLEGTCPLEIDGKVAPAVATRLLLKTQASEKRNGIYEVSKEECFGGEGTFGGEKEFGVGTKWLLTRTSDADEESEVKQGMFVLITLGATNANTTWILTTENPIVIGTTAQTFAAFTAQPVGAAGGDLTGTYPNPMIKEGAVVNADVNSAAAIAYSKLNLAASLVTADAAASFKAPDANKLDGIDSTGFLQLAVEASRKIAFGTVELEWNGAGEASNTKEVTHGLGATPVAIHMEMAVLITVAGNANLFGFGTEPTSSTVFKVNATLPTGSKPTAGTKVKFFWTAIG